MPDIVQECSLRASGPAARVTAETKSPGAVVVWGRVKLLLDEPAAVRRSALAWVDILQLPDASGCESI